MKKLTITLLAITLFSGLVFGQDSSFFPFIKNHRIEIKDFISFSSLDYDNLQYPIQSDTIKEESVEGYYCATKTSIIIDLDGEGILDSLLIDDTQGPIGLKGIQLFLSYDSSYHKFSGFIGSFAEDRNFFMMTISIPPLGCMVSKRLEYIYINKKTHELFHDIFLIENRLLFPYDEYGTHPDRTLNNLNSITLYAAPFENVPNINYDCDPSIDSLENNLGSVKVIHGLIKDTRQNWALVFICYKEEKLDLSTTRKWKIGWAKMEKE